METIFELRRIFFFMLTQTQTLNTKHITDRVPMHAKHTHLWMCVCCVLPQRCAEATHNFLCD